MAEQEAGEALLTEQSRRNGAPEAQPAEPGPIGPVRRWPRRSPLPKARAEEWGGSLARAGRDPVRGRRRDRRSPAAKKLFPPPRADPTLEKRHLSRGAPGQ